MFGILDAITNWIKDLLIGAITSNLTSMFGDVNDKVGTIAAEVGQTPAGWDINIFNMIRTISETVVLPIAGLIITYVLCAELIGMITDKNSMHEIDTFMFFKYFFKAWVAIFIVTHTFDITMAVFDLAQHLVSGAAGVIHGSTAIDIDAAIAAMNPALFVPYLNITRATYSPFPSCGYMTSMERLICLLTRLYAANWNCG